MMAKILNFVYLLLFVAVVLAVCYYSPVWVVNSIIIILLITVVLSVSYIISKCMKDDEKK